MQSLMLLEHVTPSQPSGHRQVKPSPVLTQVAPFWHGAESHARCSAAVQNQVHAHLFSRSLSTDYSQNTIKPKEKAAG